jgi:hypothetical protein
MVTASAPSWEQATKTSSQRHSCTQPPVRFTADERKVVLAELASLEDVRVRALGVRCRRHGIADAAGATAL